MDQLIQVVGALFILVAYAAAQFGRMSQHSRTYLVLNVVGYLAADAVSADARAVVDGFAAGALLVMLIDSMIPDARADAGRAAGLVTVLGFAVAAGLSSLS